MTKQEQQQFDELQLRCSKTKYRIDFIPEKDGDDGGSRYWEFYSVDEKGYEYGRENFFSIKQLQEEVDLYLDDYNQQQIKHFWNNFPNFEKTYSILKNK